MIAIAQRLKSRLEIAQSAYLNVEDIRRLLEVGYKQARRIYEIADKIDSEQLKNWRIQDRKVRITSVCKATGIPLQVLQKQIKNG